MSEERSRYQPLVNAFRVVDPASNMNTIQEACKSAVLQSTFYHASEKPFTNAEVAMISLRMFQFITDPHDGPSREIVLESIEPISGQWMAYEDFAKNYSDDLLYDNGCREFGKMAIDELRDRLKAFLAAMFFRYRYCATSDAAALPVSMILTYLNATRSLCLNEEVSWEVFGFRVLEVTLLALRSLEPIVEQEGEFQMP